MAIVKIELKNETIYIDNETRGKLKVGDIPFNTQTLRIAPAITEETLIFHNEDLSGPINAGTPYWFKVVTDAEWREQEGLGNIANKMTRPEKLELYKKAAQIQILLLKLGYTYVEFTVWHQHHITVRTSHFDSDKPNSFIIGIKNYKTKVALYDAYGKDFVFEKKNLEFLDAINLISKYPSA